MNVLAKIGELIAHFHAHGCANDLPESVQTVFNHLADEIDHLKASGIPAADSTKIEAIINNQVAKLDEELGNKLKAVVEPFLEKLQAAFAGRLVELEGEIAALKAQVAGQPASDLPATFTGDVNMNASGVTPIDADQVDPPGTGAEPTEQAKPEGEAAAS